MEPTKRCPMCGELILRIAVRCKHCQADLRGMEPEHVAPQPSAPNPYAQPAWPPAPFPSTPSSSGGSGGGSGQGSGQSTSGGHNGASRSEYVPPSEGTFEQRFLDFAFKTNLPINPATVAYALKMPIDEASEGLDDLAVRDVLIREVDARGVVGYTLPDRGVVSAGMGGGSHQGQSSTALSPYAQPPQLLYDPPGGLARVPTESTALAGLLLNVFFLPGLGSLVGGKTSAGVFQLLMFLLGLPLCLVVIGFPMVLCSWVWGLVSGVNMLAEAKNEAQRRTLAGG